MYHVNYLEQNNSFTIRTKFRPLNITYISSFMFKSIRFNPLVKLWDFYLCWYHSAKNYLASCHHTHIGILTQYKVLESLFYKRVLQQVVHIFHNTDSTFFCLINQIWSIQIFPPIIKLLVYESGTFSPACIIQC